jgi:hypothetical protein
MELFYFRVGRKGQNYVYAYKTRKYMHQACKNSRFADKTIVFFEHEVFKVVVMVTR